MDQRKITIGRKQYGIVADHDYGKHLGARFEPNTAALLECLCNEDARVLDIGANIGITGILFGQLAARGKVAAIEPVPAAYRLLESNLASAGYKNVGAFNFALGNAEGEVIMQGNPDNLSGAFVVTGHGIDDGKHFRQTVKLHKLDDVFDSFGFDGVDLIKIDVEGFELDVLEGATQTLSKHRPIVTLEMNFAALNLWRNMSLPDFRARLLDIFPHVFAVHEGEYLDFRDEKDAHDIQFRHLTTWAYMDLVAGFDRGALTNRLDRLEGIRQKNERDYAAAHPPAIQSPAPEMVPKAELDVARNRIAALEIELAATRDRIASMENSHSWMVTAPLRGVRKMFNGH